MIQNYALPIPEVFMRDNDNEKQSFLKTFVNGILKVTHLQKKNKELVSMIEGQKKIISILAHDLRNPLTAIKSIIELKKSDIIDRNDASKMMDLLTGQLDNTLEMVENVVKWGQFYLNGEKQKLEYFDFNLLVEKVFACEQLPSSLKNNALINNSNKAVSVYSDKQMLEFILRNLIGNANKFTENGNITVTLEKGLKTIIKVADTGVGMNEVRAARLFTNSHASTPGTKNEKGSGLGLLLVKAFVDHLNGSITVKSAVNMGTTIIITL
jgi:signal transduction histidine kinase